MKVLALVALLSLAACTTNGPAPVEDPRAVWCEFNLPRTLSDAEIDALSEAQVAAELEYDLKQEKWCAR